MKRHDFIAGQGLIFEQSACKRVQIIGVLCENVVRPSVARIDDLMNLGIDLLGCGFRDVLLP